LNIAQDLAHDLASAFTQAPQHHLLPELLRYPDTPVAQRVLTALRWHNRANAAGNSDDCAVLDLAVAFEALLALPKDAKTDRFVDAIALLLGRVPRLNLWAEQFYAARSDVAHEGRADHLRFMPAKAKSPSDSPLYQPLMTYGRQVFRLCVGAVLFGAHLAEQAGLARQTRDESGTVRSDMQDSRRFEFAGRGSFCSDSGHGRCHQRIPRRLRERPSDRNDAWRCKADCRESPRL